MTPEGERLEGTFVQWVAVAIWYCAGQDYDINQPSPPVTLSEAVMRMRAYNAEFDVDEVVTPEEVEAALHQLHAAGEVTRDEVGRWSLVPYDRSIFRREEEEHLWAEGPTLEKYPLPIPCKAGHICVIRRGKLTP